MAHWLIRRLYELAEEDPGKAMVLDDGTELDRRGFLEAVKKVHGILNSNGVTPGERIGLCADNSIEYVVAMCGVLHAGCTMVLLPFRDPEHRTRRLLSLASPSLIFSDNRKKIESTRAFEIARLIPSDVFDENGPSPADNPNDTSYVIFTSGSTGEPKGVCIPNDSFLHAVDRAADIMDFGPHSRSLTVLPLHFDGAFSGLFPILYRGGTAFINRGPLCMPGVFCDAMSRYSLTHATLTPTYLRVLLESDDWCSSKCANWDRASRHSNIQSLWANRNHNGSYDP
jgi:non-ribosomal peptide synthetase component F